MNKQIKAYVYAVLAVIIWSTVASAFKISLQYIGYWGLLFFASFSSLFSLFFILLIQGKLKRIKEYGKKGLMRSALMGLINPFIYYIVLFKAYFLLPAQEAQPLNYTWPIMLVVFSAPFLGQKMNWKGVLGVITGFIGVVIISTRGDIFHFRFTNLQGALLALSSAVIWALFWIFNMKDKRDDIVKLFCNFIFGFIYIAIGTAVFSSQNIFMTKGIIASFYVGLFEMGITFTIWAKALQLSETTAKVSNFIYAVPFLSLIVIHFTIGEHIFLSTIVGLVFIVIGIIFGVKE